MLGIQSAGVLEESRNLHRAVEDLPVDLRHEIDTWDPAGYGTVHFCESVWRSLLDAAGRKAYAARLRLDWAALEDKVRIDAFWDAVGVRRAPSRIVAADHDALKSRPARWTGVLERSGRPMPERAPTAAVWACGGCDTATTAGNPSCRCAGWRTRSGSCLSSKAFRQASTVSCFPTRSPCSGPSRWSCLRPIAGDRLRYAGCATAFDPLPDDRKAMRDLALPCRRQHSATRWANRGPFGIDGILADEGYLPTELNARAGAALGPLAQGVGLPLTPLCLAVIEGERLDYRPDLLEQAILRSAGCPSYLRGLVGHRQGVRREPDAGCRAGRRRVPKRADREKSPHGTVQVGPSSVGGFLRFTLRPERVERGLSAAPEVVRAFRFTDRALGTDFGEFEVARNVRPRTSPNAG